MADYLADADKTELEAAGYTIYNGKYGFVDDSSKTTGLFIKVLKDAINVISGDNDARATLILLDIVLERVKEEAFQAGKQEVIDNPAEYLDQRADDEPIRDESHD